MSTHMSVHMSVQMSAHMSVHMSVHISVHMSVHTSVHTSVHMSVHMCVHMFLTPVIGLVRPNPHRPEVGSCLNTIPYKAVRHVYGVAHNMLTAVSAADSASSGFVAAAIVTAAAATAGAGTASTVCVAQYLRVGHWP